ncbi:MAG TPA: hypothetical protein VHL59_01265 [Thermoanaerobaculia bacterium]|nr:hypothetical protein [Thermoanaerobaculia bacterium]
MADELLSVLTRFHREIVVPDIERIVGDAVNGAVDPLRNQMLTHFDGLYQRMARLESEYQALYVAVKRLEERA